VQLLKTKAIVPVHCLGVLPIWAVMAVAKEHDLFVIEDNAQAIGAIVDFRMVLNIKQEP
jgi:dTDP-4-amino-4,6-dideoxygalactose transaminase